MLTLGFEAKNQTVYQIVSSLDTDGSGSIDFGEFFNMMVTKGNHDLRDDTDKVFGLIDIDRKGVIGIKDLRRVCRQLGESLTDNELMEMIDAADRDEDGLVTMDDFFEILTKSKFP